MISAVDVSATQGLSLVLGAVTGLRVSVVLRWLRVVGQGVRLIASI